MDTACKLWKKYTFSLMKYVVSLHLSFFVFLWINPLSVDKKWGCDSAIPQLPTKEFHSGVGRHRAMFIDSSFEWMLHECQTLSEQLIRQQTQWTCTRLEWRPTVKLLNSALILCLVPTTFCRFADLRHFAAMLRWHRPTNCWGAKVHNFQESEWTVFKTPHTSGGFSCRTNDLPPKSQETNQPKKTSLLTTLRALTTKQ